MPALYWAFQSLRWRRQVSGDVITPSGFPDVAFISAILGQSRVHCKKYLIISYLINFTPVLLKTMAFWQ